MEEVMATQMPTQDEVFESIVKHVLTGAGMTAGSQVTRVLRRLYYDWIVTPGKGDDGGDAPTPQQVWTSAEGDDLRGKFKEIGQRAGSRAASRPSATFEHDDVVVSAFAVEDDSKCPWCRPWGTGS
jgi:hypothetical protein